MIVTKRALPRRTFLRGIGVTLALPLLDAMVPAFSVDREDCCQCPRRLGFVYCPNGVSMNFSGINYWKPKGVGEDFELVADPGAFRALPQPDARRQRSGASLCRCVRRWRQRRSRAGTSTWLTGVHPKHTSGADVYNGSPPIRLRPPSSAGTRRCRRSS